MPISRKSIRTILENEELNTDSRTKQLLDLLHEETDSLMDQNAELQTQLTAATKAKETAEHGKTAAEEAFSKFKADQAAQSTKAAKEAAYRQLLKDAGVSEKHIASITRVTDFDAIELDDSGKITGADKLTKSIKTEWADFITSTEEHGADVPNPPDGGNSTGFSEMSLADKMSYANAHPESAEVQAWLK